MFVIGEFTSTADLANVVLIVEVLTFACCHAVGSSVLTFFSQRFTADAHLICGMVCRDIFPSPLAIQRAVQKVPVPLQNEFEDHRRCDPMTYHGDSAVLHKSAFVGVGGNGIVLKQVLKGRKYAVKWVSYYNIELDPSYYLHSISVRKCLAR